MEILCDRIVKNLSKPKKILVGISGICGSGKSSVAEDLRVRLASQGHQVMIIPMDGYHVPKSLLAEMPNAEEAFKRRGAHWTFDSHSFVNLIESLREDKLIVPSHTSFNGEKRSAWCTP